MMAKLVDFNLIECDKILFEETSLQSYGYGIVSQLPMKDRELSIQAKGVYSYLVSCAGNDKQTYPTQEKMCYDLGIKKVDTLKKYIKQIQARGYIKIVKTKKGNLYYRNVYLIATDTRTIEIWKREFKEGKEIEEAEVIRNISIQKVKDRPNSYIYKLSLPSWVIEILGVSIEDRQIKITESEGKIVIEKDKI
jgi:hypothetical protein